MSLSGVLGAAPRAGLRGVLAVGEFRALWVSHALSAGGDRLALVALTVLVWDRTRSPFLAAVAYGAGTLPYLFGGLFLVHLTDRLPGRAVMTACDLTRAALTIVMALPGMPPALLVVLLYLVTAVQPVFDAVRAALARDMLGGGQLYATGTTVLQVTYRLVLTGGAAAAGLAVAATGARAALAVDAATFLASAALIRTCVGPRPVASRTGNHGDEDSADSPGGVLTGLRVVLADPVLRTVMGLGWLAVFYEVPEGIAAPYAAAAGGSPAAAGLLIAAGQAMIVAAPLWVRLPEAARQRWMGPMAAAAAGTLMLTGLHPGIAGSAVIFAAAGMFGTYQVTAGTTFASAAPAACRTRALGIAAAGLVTGQGLAFAAAGWAAQVFPPAAVTAAAGSLGAVIACGLAVSWHRLLPETRRTAEARGGGKAQRCQPRVATGGRPPHHS